MRIFLTCYIILLMSFSFLNNCILAIQMNKDTRQELIIPISLPYANKIIDINTMNATECTFGYVYHSKIMNTKYLITSLLRPNNNVIIFLFKEEYNQIC